MDKKEYTTGNTCNINSDLKYDISDKFNFDSKSSNYFQGDLWNFYWCQYYLPCGLCEKTMQPCLKRSNQGGDKFFIVNDNKIEGGSHD